MNGSRPSAALVLACTLLSGCGGGQSASTPPIPTPPTPLPLVRAIGADPFSNASSQHATIVEPSASAVGSTIVVAFQAGRYPVFASSDIGFATSPDGGATWTSGMLPGMTRIVSATAQFDGASDPAVAYDAAHRTWLISSAPLSFASLVTPGPLVSRSSDGVTWSDPVFVAAAQNQLDKPWSVCDNSAVSPFFGHCYIVWDEVGLNGLIHVSVSTDGGATWSALHNTANAATGIGAQPVVKPNGTVIVPVVDFDLANVLAFTSADGGATWSAATLAAPIFAHQDAHIRSTPFPSAQVDAAGRVYLLWQDCRFRANCAANDLVLSTSDDGIAWSSPARVPIDALASTADHFIPGLGLDGTTAGAGAALGVTYYSYSDTACTADQCRLFVGFTGSHDGGATWTTPVTLIGPLQTSWLAHSPDGPMAADYIATVFSQHRPVAVFAAATPPIGSTFAEALYVSSPGALTLQAATRRTSRAERLLFAGRSDRVRRPGP